MANRKAPSPAKVLVTGSTALDVTGAYDGSFAAYQAQLGVDAFNASFDLSAVKRSFGGCCINISYGLHLLGIDALPLSSTGRDFESEYKTRLETLGMNVDHIMIDERQETVATCLMISDREGNQIIGFYPGETHDGRPLPSELPEIAAVTLAMLAPERPPQMLRQAEDLAKLDIPVILDPGQCVTGFARDELRALLRLGDTLILNEYEFTALTTIAEVSEQEALGLVPRIVVTRGPLGANIMEKAGTRHVPGLSEIATVDATGCGDAFRAGYVYGQATERDAVASAEFGCIMAALNLGAAGTQNYQASSDELETLRKRHYRA